MVKYTSEQRNLMFWNRVAVRDIDDCWLWLGRKDKDGYGKTSLHHKSIRAHRFSYQIIFGEFDEKLFVLHSCDNPTCVNPKHLFLGTNQDNVDDREQKGRNNPVLGEAHGGHKLTEVEVISIRKEYANGLINQRQLALKYNISYQMISRIVNLLNWKEV